MAVTRRRFTPRVRFPSWAGVGTAVLLVWSTFPIAAQEIGSSSDAALTTGGAVADGIVDLVRLSGPIVLDGLSDEPAWKDLAPVPLTMYEPTFRGSSDRRIELRLGYDDEAIYLAARFYHDDPSAIRAFSLTRDRWSGDDSFGILLDTFNDNENALRFVGMPLGARMDMSVTGDGQQESGGAGGPRNSSWNTFWDLETRITDDGWFGEMRIPFSSLRFEAEPDGSVIMGMMAYAYEPASGARWTFPAIPRRFPYTQVSAWQDVRLEGVEPRSPIYVSPYGLTSATRNAELSASGDEFVGVSDRATDVGLDIKINPTPNLTLDLTLNTDFASVEADAQQVNLTRFSLFFDEKRPFFQERAGIFSFATGADRGTLFYSRRIGLAEGEPIPIVGGARLVGRIGSWDVGLIEMQTASERGIASENFGVLRVRRRVLNANSFVGGMMTSRVDADGLYNVTYGLDGLIRAAGDDYVTVKWLQTVQGGDAVRDAGPGGLDAARIVLDWTRRRFEGFSYQQALTWSGPGYDPAMGFEPRSDFVRAQSDWSYQWYPGESSRFRRLWVGAENNIWVRNADDRVDTGQIRPFVQVETKPGATIKLTANTLYEDVRSPFSLSDDVEVLAGRYWVSDASLEFRAPRGWGFRPNLTLTAGEFFDGSRATVKWSHEWAVNQYLELGGDWEWNRIQFDTRDLAFTSNLVAVKAEAAVNTRLSMNAFVQYNSLTDQVATNARFRYNFREGQDLWLVWNEGLNLNRDPLAVPRLPLESARTLTIKYTHTLVL